MWTWLPRNWPCRSGCPHTLGICSLLPPSSGIKAVCHITPRKRPSSSYLVSLVWSLWYQILEYWFISLTLSVFGGEVFSWRHKYLEPGFSFNLLVFFFFNLKSCVYDCFTSMYICAPDASSTNASQNWVLIPRTGVTGSCEMPCEF